MSVVRFHPFEGEEDPVVYESIVRAAKLTNTFTRAGLDAFEFKSEHGTHYVVNRGPAMGCMQFDQLVCYTSPRMVDALHLPWSAPGKC